MKKTFIASSMRNKAANTAAEALKKQLVSNDEV